MNGRDDGPESPVIDPEGIEPLAPEGDPAVRKGNRGDPADCSLPPLDQSEEAVPEDERG